MLSLTDFVVSARNSAFALPSTFSESSTTFARSRSYVHIALPSAHMSCLPLPVHVGNSPPIVFNFFTGTGAAAGADTFTVGGVLPTCVTVMVYKSMPTIASACSPFGDINTSPAGGGCGGVGSPCGSRCVEPKPNAPKPNPPLTSAPIGRAPRPPMY